MGAVFFTSLVGMLVVMGAAWAVQRSARNAGWVDVFWTFGTGAACVMAALAPTLEALPERQMLVAALGAAWSVRLGTYVALRVARSSEDSRYVRLREDWGRVFQSRMLGLVLVQAPVTALMTLSVFVAAHAEGALGWRDALGASLLLIAIAGEALADEQMRMFKARGQHGGVMQQGLWAWSRHPNYFFEWLGWLAYPAIGFDPQQPLTWLTWIAPALMYLVLRYGTGVPALERTMLESRGEAFRRYQQDVSPFFPWPPRRSAP